MENTLIQINISKLLLSSHGPLQFEICASINPGELVSVFGISGAGKTSLLRMLSGLMQPDHGYIKVGNEVWFDSSARINLPPQKRNIGFMFQDYALFPNMTVGENISFAQKNKDRKFVKKLLNLFELEEFEHRRPEKLSGGQKQRVALARALAAKPSLLLLDEPLSALDASMRQRLQNEILKAHRISGATTLLVSHDLAEVFRLSSLVWIIEDGKIVRSGPAAHVFAEHNSTGKFRFVAEVISIQKEDILYVLTLLIGNTITRVIATPQEAETLSAGDKVTVLAKAFNPIISKI
jgi:molybdate transport system ATP-binding protein